MASEVRIEIAELMRGYFDTCECMGHTFINGTLCGMQVCARDETALRDGMWHLADLIDPTCHVFASDGLFACDRCRTLLLGMRAKPSFCPHCGARVVSGNER